MTWVVAQLGARMHYAVPRLLHEAGCLERLYTDIYADNALLRPLSHLPTHWLPPSMRRLLARVDAHLPRERVVSYPLFGLSYYARRIMAADPETMSAVHLSAGVTFGKRVVRDGFGRARAVYTFNTAALEILTFARGRGLFSVLEQTIAPRAFEESLLAEERARFPDWESQQLPGGTADETAKREVDEWALADMILCGSQFVRDCIARCGGPVERCVVVPYGVDVSFPTPAPSPHSGPLRVLTVGQVCLRKGAPYALEAAQMLKGIAELRWVGQVTLSTKAHERLAKAIQLTGTVPRTEIVAHYEWADVIFLPSVCEGSALVTYEALSRGLPVVTTPHAGSVVRDGVDGFIVSVGDTTAMAARLRQIHEDRTLLARLSAGAMESAREVALPAYRERLLRALGLR